MSIPHDLFFGTSGSPASRIMLVGEAWGAEEAEQQRPFVGGSGRVLDAMLRDGGLRREDLFLTNIVAGRPAGNAFWRYLEPAPRRALLKKELLYHGLHASPELITEHQRLIRQVAAIQPDLIIACGNYPLWAFSDEPTIKLKSQDLEGVPLDGGSRLLPSGIQNYRGSMLWTRPIAGHRYRLLPVLHPALIIRDWSSRHLFVHDIRFRAQRALSGLWDDPSPPRLIIRPSLAEVEVYLAELERRLASEVVEVSNDVETSRGLTTCIGLCYEPSCALVIPWLDKLPDGTLASYWADPRDEATIRHRLGRLFRHPNWRSIGQNYNYDRAYIDEEFGVVPSCSFDTMLAQHLLFPGTDKGLGFISSLYCSYHRYWKDDSKEWTTNDRITADDHYRYNATDCLRTLEAATVLRTILASQGMDRLYAERLRIMDWCYRTTAPGIRADLRRRNALYVQLLEAAEARDWYLRDLFPEELINRYLEARSPARSFKPSKTAWYASPQKLAVVLYDILDLPRQYIKKTQRLSTDSKALETLVPQFPEFKLLFTLIEQMRSIRVYKSTFLEAVPERDLRYRTFLDPTGAGTFRFSSYENPFGRGLNLQNVPGD